MIIVFDFSKKISLYFSSGVDLSNWTPAISQSREGGREAECDVVLHFKDACSSCSLKRAASKVRRSFSWVSAHFI